MRNILAKLHDKLGDFWFDSLMVFVACRAADVINLFVGLWLVPKYVTPEELGAVMPLSSFANFLVIPITIFTTTFTKEINVLALNKKYGQMKTLLRDVFIGASAFLVLSIFITKLTIPHFLERIRVENGSLGFLIIASAFIASVSPIYTNTLQALKKFKEYTLLNVVGSPLRFVTMVIAMPYRALSGYFVGQAAPPAFSIITALFFLRKELSVKAEPYWSSSTTKRFLTLFSGIAIYTCAVALQTLAEQTVLRQRLPDLESAAFYMVSRFSEMSGLLACTLTLTLFPYTSEAAEQGKSTRSFVFKSAFLTLLFAIAISSFFIFFGKLILSFLPQGDQYARFHWAIPWLILITAFNSIQGFHYNTEISARRFCFLKWLIPFRAASIVILMAITGYGYFTAYLPASWLQFLSTYNITSLSSMLIWLTVQSVIPLFFCARDLNRQC